MKKVFAEVKTVHTELYFGKSLNRRSTTSELISPPVYKTCKSTSIMCIPTAYINSTLIYRLNNMME